MLNEGRSEIIDEPVLDLYKQRAYSSEKGEDTFYFV
jgi:hypothetical protein